MQPPGHVHAMFAAQPAPVLLSSSWSPPAGHKHTWTRVEGFIPAGGDAIPPRLNVTLSDAKALCDQTHACAGITFHSDVPSPNGTIAKVYFKYATQHTAAAGWQSYLRDVSAVRAAAMRTADGRSLVLPFVNPTVDAVALTVSLSGGAVDASASVSLTTLSAGSLGAVNTPATPDAVAPRLSQASPTSSTSLTFTIPAQSFVIAAALLA